MAGTLAVSEVFGPTLQGEGPSIGTPATFLRTAGCNLACVWCDTPYTWDWKRFNKAEQVHQLTLAQVEDALAVHRPTGDAPLVVVTGGEPMLQQAALTTLFAETADPWRVEVETAGTIAPQGAWADLVSLFVVSPKLAHSGNDLTKAHRAAALRSLSDTGRVAWKFVCAVPDDVAEAARFVEHYELQGPVYIMPEGRSVETLGDRARYLAPTVMAHGYRLTPRLHVELWGDTRGH